MAANNGHQDIMLALPPAARYLNVQAMLAQNPAIPPASYHYVMEADCGRIPQITAAMVDGHQVAPPAFQPAVDIVVRQRTKVRFLGLKRWAALGLYKPHPSGLAGQPAEIYLTTPHAATELARLIHLAKTNAVVGNVQRWKVRVDVEINFTQQEGQFDPEEYVDWGPIDVHVPYIYTQAGDPRIVGDHASVMRYAVAYLDDLMATIEHKTSIYGSNRVFDRLIGAIAWATPCCVAHGAGNRQSRRGEVALNPAVNDNMCIARAIVTALDPMIYSRSACSLMSLVENALEGAAADVVNAEKRVCSSPVGSVVHLKRGIELSAARCRHAACLAGVQTAIAAARVMGTFLDKGVVSAVDATRAVRRYTSIETALKRALDGQGRVDLSHSFFRSEQIIDANAAAFISSCMPPSVKIQFWTRNADDGVALSYPAAGATLQYLLKGGQVVNLYCDEGHVTVMSSVNTLCSSLSSKHQRTYCELCGVNFGHTGAASLFHSKTAVMVHQEAGCPRRGGAVMTRPLSQENIHQLPVRDFVSRWPLSLHASLVAPSDSECAVALLAWTPAGPLPVSSRMINEWTAFLDRFSARDNVSRDGELARVTAALPRGDSGADACFTGSVSDMLTALFRTHAKFVWGLVTARYYRCASACALLRSGFDPLVTRCAHCDGLVAGPSRTRIQTEAFGCTDTEDYERVPEEEDESEEAACEFDPLSSDSPVLTSCPVNSTPAWAHASCAAATDKRYNADATLIVDVGSMDAMALVATAVMSPEFVQTVCKGTIPSLRRDGNSIRSIRFRVLASDEKKRKAEPWEVCAFTVKFRGPGVAGVTLPPSCPPMSSTAESAALSVACADASVRSLAVSRMNVLYFETEVSYARTSLYASAQFSRPVTSLVCYAALASYNLLAKGGRILTGCAVMHPPLDPPTDRSTVRLCLDFTAAYPSVAINFPLPHEGHLDAVVADFSTDLAGGVAYIRAVDARDAGRVIGRVVVSGCFSAETHAGLLQFPPLFSRRVVPVGMFSAFQVRRLGRLLHPDKARTVSHLMPIERETMFLREAQLLERLGFCFTFVGEIRGCPASFWAKGFMQRGEELRRSAASPQLVADIKRVYNSVVGSTNINMEKHPSLKTVWSKDVVPEDGFRTGAAGLEEGDARKGRRTTRLSDDPRFTGRVFATDHVTMIERFPDRWLHKTQPEWALAVQAYARCDQLELWYGSPETPGVLAAFPAARLIYGNTDSIVVELTLTAAHRAAGFTDARTAIYDALKGRMDLSNVPATSTFWDSFRSPAERDAARASAVSDAGRWGWVKEETGMAGFETVVVNGPNRWGARVVQSDTDTLPKHVKQRDILKMLRKPWLETSLEQYAASWGGGHTSAEVEELRAASREGIDVPAEGTCVWGNTACVVNEDGTQVPFGAAHTFTL